MLIDPHVHCRDGKQRYKETIEHVFEIAKKQGVDKIFDMPNTDPPILRGADVWKRLALVPKDQEGNYFLYMGATADDGQLAEAVECYRHCKEVVGIKLYAGRSVGDLAVVSEEAQRKVYRNLARLGYKGVLAVHCEKESYLRPALWDPTRPITHSQARPKEAEIASLEDQIKFAKESGFQGTLHIVHISCPESVEIVDKARAEIKISCGVTPHHILWDNEMLDRPDGLLYKMNPPLRGREEVARLRQYLREGKIDWIETDHAPHPLGEKLFPPYASGYPSLYLYRNFVTRFLPQLGIGKKLIKKLTSGNILRVFANKLGSLPNL